MYTAALTSLALVATSFGPIYAADDYVTKYTSFNQAGAVRLVAADFLYNDEGEDFELISISDGPYGTATIPTQNEIIYTPNNPCRVNGHWLDYTIEDYQLNQDTGRIFLTIDDGGC